MGAKLDPKFRAANALCKELWVCERDADRLEQIKSRFPQVKATQSFEEVLLSNVDAVVLATPVGTHFPLAKKALESGKHVFVEKPLASSVAEAEELVQLADEKPDTDGWAHV